MKKSFSQAQKKNVDTSTVVWEYTFPTTHIGLATVKINGRHPQSGCFANTRCEIMYYCISGSGTITIEKEKFTLQPGDVLYIDKNKRYFIEGQNLFICLPSAPAWTPEQSQILEGEQ